MLHDCSIFDIELLSKCALNAIAYIIRFKIDEMISSEIKLRVL